LFVGAEISSQCKSERSNKCSCLHSLPSWPLAAVCCYAACCLLHCCLRRFCRYSVPAASSLRRKADVVTPLDKRARQYSLGELTLDAQERAFRQSHPILISVAWVIPKPFRDDGNTVVWPRPLLASSY
jgi:hypothetical protein